MLQYEIYSLWFSNKTALGNSQHCTKLRNEVHNVLHNKIYSKIDFYLCFGLVKTAKNKVYILKREITLTW